MICFYIVDSFFYIFLRTTAFLVVLSKTWIDPGTKNKLFKIDFLLFGYFECFNKRLEPEEEYKADRVSKRSPSFLSLKPNIILFFSQTLLVYAD